MMGRTLSTSSASSSATVSPRATSPAEEEEDETNAVCHWIDCGRTFDDVTQLGRHVLDVHVSRVSNSDPTSGRCHWRDCPRSGKAFSTKMKLIMHLRSHTGEKPYPCTVPGCPKRFARMDILSKHLRSHANNAQRLSALQGAHHPHPHHAPHAHGLVCQVCGQHFTDRAALDAHVAAHPFVKAFVCPAVGCGRRFGSLQALYSHAEQHGGAGAIAAISPPTSSAPSPLQSFTPGATAASAPASFSFGVDPFNELAAAARLAATDASQASGAARVPPQRTVTGHRPALGSWPLAAPSAATAGHRGADTYGPYGRVSPTGVFKRRGPSDASAHLQGPLGRSLSAETAPTATAAAAAFALPPIAALTGQPTNAAAAAAFEEPKRLRVSRSEADLNRPLADSANAALPHEMADRAADLELLQFFAEHNRGPMLPPLSHMAPTAYPQQQQQQQQQQQRGGHLAPPPTAAAAALQPPSPSYYGAYASSMPSSQAIPQAIPHRPRQHSHQHAPHGPAHHHHHHEHPAHGEDGPLRMSRSETSLTDLLDSARHHGASAAAMAMHHPLHHGRGGRATADAMDDDADDDAGAAMMVDEDSHSAPSSLEGAVDDKRMALSSILSMHTSPTASFSGALTPPWAGSTASSQATSPTSATAPQRFVPPHSDLLAYKYPTATQQQHGRS